MPNSESDSQPARKRVHVAVGVVINSQQEILLAKRADHQHQGGLWEFPGGKVEAGETLPKALGRELHEELAITVTSCEPLLEVAHEYTDKSVLLDVWLVTGFNGQPRGVEGQPLAWVSVAELNEYPFPEANVPIVEKLQSVF